jgi:hypothetical protein
MFTTFLDSLEESIQDSSTASRVAVATVFLVSYLVKNRYHLGLSIYPSSLKTLFLTLLNQIMRFLQRINEAISFRGLSISGYPVLQNIWSYKSKKASERFGDVGNTYIHLAEITNEKPYEFPYLKSGASPHLTVGLRRLKRGNWLTIDDKYLPEHSTRSIHLSQARPSVLHCLLGSESACQEVLSLVSSLVVTRYPMMVTFRNRL